MKWLKNQRNNVINSEFWQKLSKKTEKAVKTLKWITLNILGIRHLIYFIKHANPMFLGEEKELILYKYIRTFLNWTTNTLLTGIFVNFVLKALFEAEFTITTIPAYGIAWWLIEKQILKRSIDYLTTKAREIKR